jgi:hypothetical protein
MSARDISIRSAASLLSAFELFTLVWILWGYFTSGDFFGNGSALVTPSLAIAGIIGLIAGFRAKGWWSILILGISIASLCFWIFAPDGWWAHEPR